MQPLHAGQTWNRYRVDAYLGGGAMADVYLVTHEELGVKRALKVLKRVGAEATPRLLREGQVQATLMHPNVVPVLELIRVHGHPALVMDYVDGPPLDAFLDRGRPTLEQIDVIARGILDGMVAAHRSGVVHRDLKPANVLLDLRTGTPVARITDFGLAKAVSEDDISMTSTASGMMMGTPRYMAPEQFRDAKTVDERADVWAVGALLYELLTGMCAFPGDSIIDTLRNVDAVDYTPIDELRPDAPARMVLAIEEALIKELDDRCESMAELRSLWVGNQKVAGTASWTVDELRRTPVPLPEHDGSMEPVASTFDLSPTGQRPPGGSVLVTLGAVGVGLAAILAVAVVAVVAIVVFSGVLGIGTPQAVPEVAESEAGDADQVQAATAEEAGADARGRADDAPDQDAVVEIETPKPSQPLVTPATIPSPAPAAAPVEPAPEPVRFGEWEAKQSGSAPVQMRLRSQSEGTWHDPGRVPAGGYDLYVRWKGETDWERLDGTSIRADERVVFSCNGLTFKCARQ